MDRVEEDDQGTHGIPLIYTLSINLDINEWDLNKAGVKREL